jgi:hypothetical protein
MILSSATISGIVERLWNEGTVTDDATEYGEPGYRFDNETDTNRFLLGDWWCRCGKNPHAGKPHGYGNRETKPDDLHGVEAHHPRLWAQLAEQGIECAFYDEWWVDCETGKAYRTQPDSYSWQSSIQWNEDMCDYMTPDHDFDVWLEWAVNDTSRCLMASWRSELEAAGFTQWEPNDPHRYHNGWHEGMTDDPVKVRAEIDRWSDEQEDVVFLLDETSQFYVGFSAWTRPSEVADDAAADAQQHRDVEAYFGVPESELQWTES